MTEHRIHPPVPDRPDDDPDPNGPEGGGAGGVLDAVRSVLRQLGEMCAALSHQARVVLAELLHETSVVDEPAGRDNVTRLPFPRYHGHDRLADPHGDDTEDGEEPSDGDPAGPAR